MQLQTPRLQQMAESIFLSLSSLAFYRLYPPIPLEHWSNLREGSRFVCCLFAAVAGIITVCPPHMQALEHNKWGRSESIDSQIAVGRPTHWDVWAADVHYLLLRLMAQFLHLTGT